jgi:hypothetical protein
MWECRTSACVGRLGDCFTASLLEHETGAEHVVCARGKCVDLHNFCKVWFMEQSDQHQQYNIQQCTEQQKHLRQVRCFVDNRIPTTDVLLGDMVMFTVDIKLQCRKINCTDVS